jgi:hypothetical protein
MRNLIEPNSVSVAKDLIAILRDIFVAIGLILFFVGYVYRFVYMRSLGVPVHATQSPVNELMIYAYTVFQSQWPWIAAFLATISVVVVVFEVALQRSRSQRMPLRRLRIGIVIVAGLCIVPLSETLAGNAALSDASGVRSGYYVPHVQLAFTTAALRSIPMPLRLSNDAGFLVILDETQDAYFILDQPLVRGTHTKDGAAVTYRLPKKFVEYVSTVVP